MDGLVFNMKIQKSILKNLIKECLVEILIEGIDGIGAQKLSESRMQQKISQRQIVQQTKIPVLTKHIDQGAKADDVIQEMLMHTAQTTLQEHLDADNNIEQHINQPMTNVPLEELNVDKNMTNIWTALAFNKPKSKIQQ